MSYKDMSDGELANVLLEVTTEMDRRRAAQVIPQKLAEAASEAQRVGFDLDTMGAVLGSKIAEVKGKVKTPPSPTIPNLPNIPGLPGGIPGLPGGIPGITPNPK